eukprot:IDg19569t1
MSSLSLTHPNFAALAAFSLLKLLYQKSSAAIFVHCTTLFAFTAMLALSQNYQQKYREIMLLLCQSNFKIGCSLGSYGESTFSVLTLFGSDSTAVTIEP